MIVYRPLVTYITGVPCPSPPPCWNMYPNKGGGKGHLFWRKSQNFWFTWGKNTTNFPPEAKKCILTCSYEKWTAGGEKFSRFARRKCIFLKEIDGFVIKYLKIFPAGLLNSLTKKAYEIRWCPSPPLVETCTLTGGKDKGVGEGLGIPVISGIPRFPPCCLEEKNKGKPKLIQILLL